MNKMKFGSLPIDYQPIRITSEFGKRNTGIIGASTYHKGLDIGRNNLSSSKTTKILSVADGVIETNTFNSYRGYYVVVKHDGIYRTLYQHLKLKSPLGVGAKVKAGQQIGLMGSSRDVKAIPTMSAHLHFELHENKVPIDPYPFIKEVNEVDREEVQKMIDQSVQKALSSTGNCSDWAKAPIEWAKSSGVSDGTNPKSYCTREQVTTMLYNFFNKIIKK